MKNNYSSSSKFVKHIPCENCGSSDGNSLFDDGHTFCFVCETRTPAGHVSSDNNKNNNMQERPLTPLAANAVPLHDRNIKAATARTYSVANHPDEADKRKHVYPYFDADGVHIANKIRYRDKSFSWEGDVKRATLFGQSNFPAGSAKQITIVEGELDALAAYEMMGSRYPVVSVKSGAAGALDDVGENFEYLNSFERIVICFDKDEAKVNPKTGQVSYPGQEAAIRVANMFAIGKVRVLTLADHKDASDYLVAGKSKQFLDEWWKAPSYTPTGLKIGKDMWEEISNPPKYETINYPWQGLQDKTYGLRLSEFVVLTAETGVGKTSVFKELEHHIIASTDNAKLGLLHLEEPNRDTALGLMSVGAERPLHLPDVMENTSREELKEFYDSSVNSDRVVIYDHFGSNSVHEILNKIRHMHNMGCKYIFLDHLSIVVSDQSGDERKQLDEISTKIKTLCMELNIAVIAVIHLNRQGEIRGTAGVEQLANIVIRLRRNKEDMDEKRRNVTRLDVVKNRFCGRTGPACWLMYNEMTGRLREMDEEAVMTYEAGGSPETW